MSSLSEVSVALTCYDSILPPTLSLFITEMAFFRFISVPGGSGTIGGGGGASGLCVKIRPCARNLCFPGSIPIIVGGSLALFTQVGQMQSNTSL